MRSRIKSAWLSVLLIGCAKHSLVSDPIASPLSRVSQTGINPTASIMAEPLSMDSLFGVWLLIDSEGQIDKSGDRLSIGKFGNEYEGVLEYQGTKKICQLNTDGKAYWLLAESGERYDISRLRSIHMRGNNGIGLALNTGFDDIGLGFFQREDILKKLEGQ